MGKIQKECQKANALNDEQRKLIENYLDDGYRKAKVCIIRTVKQTPNEELFDEYMGIVHNGLVKAALRFSPEKGMKFESFATMTICNEIKTYLTRQNRKKRKCELPTVSLDECLMNDDGILIEETIQDNKAEAFDFGENMVEAVLSKMNRFEKRVTELFMNGYSTKEISQILRCTEKQISTIKNITYKRMDILITINSYMKGSN